MHGKIADIELLEIRQHVIHDLDYEKLDAAETDRLRVGKDRAHDMPPEKYGRGVDNGQIERLLRELIKIIKQNQASVAD